MNPPISRPTKEQMRAYLGGMVSSHKPPKTPGQIKRELGWDLIKQTKNAP